MTNHTKEALPVASASLLRAEEGVRLAAIEKLAAPLAITETEEKWANEVLDKQYRLYGWSDVKAQALITTNGLLFAAIGLLYRDGFEDVLTLVAIIVGAASIATSLCFCLTHAVPFISSGRTGTQQNPRSLKGINSYPTWEEYLGAFSKLDRKTFYVHSIRQIYGMAANNFRSERLLRRGARFTVVGVAAIMLTIIFNAMSARNIHLLGTWRVQAVPQISSSSPPSLSNPPSDQRKQSPAPDSTPNSTDHKLSQPNGPRPATQ